jgi:ligand-binding SRPBCC domain-containing protein
MTIRHFHSETWLPATRADVFAFFSDAGNLDAITPPWLRFRILTPAPIEMREGAVIDYALRIRGVPLRWRSRIRAWDPPHRFVDEQVRGPYRVWVHEHRFEPKDGGTLVVDDVAYSVRFDALIHGWLVRPDVERIFRFRTAALHALSLRRPRRDVPGLVRSRA